MKATSTLFLKAIIILFGLIVAALCTFVLPKGILSPDTGGYRPILIGMYIPAIPFFIGLHQAWKLLNYINDNQAFSHASVKALQIIKYCGIAIATLYGIAMPYIFQVANRDDAPGVMLIGLIFTVAPLIIATFAAVLNKVLHDAILIQTEHNSII